VVPRPLLYQLWLTVSLTIHRTLSSYLRCTIARCIIVTHTSKTVRLQSARGRDVSIHTIAYREAVFWETRCWPLWPSRFLTAEQ
jgi:hypothetical protein